MVINHPPKGGKRWFLVLLERGGGVYWAMAGDGGEWGEMGWEWGRMWQRLGIHRGA